MINITKIRDGKCRWPMWDHLPPKPDVAVINFCGCASLAGKPYCEAHYERSRGRGPEPSPPKEGTAVPILEVVDDD